MCLRRRGELEIFVHDSTKTFPTHTYTHARTYTHHFVIHLYIHCQHYHIAVKNAKSLSCSCLKPVVVILLSRFVIFFISTCFTAITKCYVVAKPCHYCCQEMSYFFWLSHLMRSCCQCQFFLTHETSVILFCVLSKDYCFAVKMKTNTNQTLQHVTSVKHTYHGVVSSCSSPVYCTHTCQHHHIWKPAVKWLSRTLPTPVK